MKYVRIIFSPTGGTEKAARALTAHWPSSEKVNLAAPDGNYTGYSCRADDIVLIAMPSYGGLAPQIALDRLSLMKGNSAKCILLCVYGNRAYEDTLVQMEDTAAKCGFQVTAAVSAVAEHSIMHQYAAGRPNQKDRAQLAGFESKISEKVRKGDTSSPKLPGSRPYKKAGSLGLVPKADSNCSKCGLCAQQCPVQAIDPQSLKTADKKKCISCMRCVSVCPRKSRKVSGLMVSAAALAMKKACSEPKQNELFL